MDKKYEEEFSEEALKRLYIDVKKFSLYTDEGQAALCGYTPMTEEIFESCRSIAFALWDEQTLEYLLINYPQFWKR